MHTAGVSGTLHQSHSHHGYTIRGVEHQFSDVVTPIDRLYDSEIAGTRTSRRSRTGVDTSNEDERVFSPFHRNAKMETLGKKLHL